MEYAQNDACVHVKKTLWTDEHITAIPISVTPFLQKLLRLKTRPTIFDDPV